MCSISVANNAQFRLDTQALAQGIRSLATPRSGTLARLLSLRMRYPLRDAALPN